MKLAHWLRVRPLAGKKKENHQLIRTFALQPIAFFPGNPLFYQMEILNCLSISLANSFEWDSFFIYDTNHARVIPDIQLNSILDLGTLGDGLLFTAAT
ncbi:hypothetical protein [Dyadobacter koreensis]|uniref:hypothetical protein n=1 Tax=Dyadobacter koreensis TaxID=408657 RepID=UPI0011601A90|nr:hypothetical protein [Dyadobacter koreensis]